MNNLDNILVLSDSYKVTHWPQLETGTTRIFSYLESRGGRFPTITFFGLQYFINKYLTGKVVTDRKIKQAKKYFAEHFGSDKMFNEAGWKYIVNVHNGKLPVVIRAVREGTVIGTSQVLVTIENTDDNCAWLTNYLESLLLQVWYPSTVATQSREMKKVILKYLEETGDPSLIDFKLHDFGLRGSTSIESSAIGGAAHLTNFKGTDTFPAIVLARQYYFENMAGFSIPAAEHSTITSWGRDRESEAYKNMLVQFPTGLVAVVSDSYDIFHACKEIWGKELKDLVMSRDGTLVIRPDSGNPQEILPRILDILGEAFGFSYNAKGYKVLDSHVRIIQGDGIDYYAIDDILGTLKFRGWSADNIAFGSGGGLLQVVNRDTQKFAFKCSAVKVNGQWRDVMKSPVTDPGKRSKTGRLALITEDGEKKTVTQEYAEANGFENELIRVFENGIQYNIQTFAEIRTLAQL